MYDVKPITTEHPRACGPACLKMLLDYYGQNVELEQLIQECNVGIAGCGAKDLKRVGNAHGLDITYWKMDAEGILAADRPAILWWRFQHFVVFCGLNDKGEPVICNPASGRFPVSLDTFARAFSGIVLCNGTPEDYVPKAEGNYAEGEIFQAENKTYIALRTITRGEKLVTGWNCELFDIIAALNAQNKKEE